MNGCRGAAGAPHRLTAGSAQEGGVAIVKTAAGSQMFYASLDQRQNIYRLPLLPSAGASGLVPLTDDAALDFWPSLSRDGLYAGVSSMRGRVFRTRVRDLSAATEVELPTNARMPAVSPDGKFVAIVRDFGVSIVPIAGGGERRLSIPER